MIHVLSPIAGAVSDATRPKLRPYQQELKNDIYNHWNDHQHSNVLAVLPTGAGKTVFFSSIIAEHVGATCAVAHRQELVSQISLALARNKVRHRIIGPTNVVKMIVRLHMEEVGHSYYDPNSHHAVAGVDTLVRRRDQLANWLPTVKLWVMDECFTAGTMIDGKPISDIRIGDEVTAFNETTGDFETRRVTRLFKNPAPEEMMRVETQLHHVLYCTKGHPFWTKRGWVNAQDLTTKDEVLVNEVQVQLLRKNSCRNERISAVSVSEDRENILSRFVRIQNEGRTEEEKISENRDYDLHMVQSEDRSHGRCAVSVSQSGTSVLYPGVLPKLQSENFIRNNESDKLEVRFGTYEKQQSDGKSGGPGESTPDTHCFGTSTCSKRWERSPCDTGRNGAVRNVFGNGIQLAGDRTNRTPMDIERLSKTLQNRLCQSGVDDCDRSGRFESLNNCATGAGCAENAVSHWVRLDSVEILKSTDITQSGECVHDGYVYNFEVEGLHTYVANGVTVHNCHHVLQDNKWGKAVNMFRNARGLGVTATPSRADGCGLGSHADGVFDKMFVGPSMRDLINMGYLTDYKLYAPPSSFRRDAIKKVSQTTGDFVASEVSKAVNESSLVAHDEKQIVGDVVRTYQKLLNGMLTVVFAPDVATATELEKQYNDAGIPAKCVHGAMPDAERINAVRKFKNREYLVLTSVAIFDEGFDCPAIEAVQDVSATESFGRFVQRAGRMLRLKDGKLFGRYVDHVGNIERHAVLVDHPEGTKIELCHREWTLDRREKSGGKSEKSAVRACVACGGTYERYLKACPYCGEPIPEPAAGQRSSVEWVDGDLHELDPAVLAQLQGEVIGAREDVNQYRDKMIGHGLPPHAVKRNVKLHENRLDALVRLDHTLAQWAGYRRAEGLSDSEIFRKFYLTYGVSWIEAQALKADDADKLRERIGL